MADKELLKQMINHIVYDREDEAKATFHDFVAAKTQQIMGTEEAPAVDTLPADDADIDENSDQDME